MRIRLLAAALAAFLLVPAGTAPAKIRKGPAGVAFYTPPKKLPGKAHGDVIWARKATRNAALAGARSNSLVLYRSNSLNNKAVAVSGSIALPKGKAPKSGWPVVTWAHGTTGIADGCAPSRAAVTSDTYTTTVRRMFSTWLRAGYAVARTDYEGLGTPGLHPFLIGRSEARSLLDIARAARKLDPRVGRRVLVAGHSQGGQAALFAPAVARKWTPELSIRGTFAWAPPSQYRDQIGLAGLVTDPSPLSAFFLLAARGIEVTSLSVPVQTILSDRAKSYYPDTESKCIGDLYKADSAGGMPPKELFREGADLKPIADYADTMDPGKLTLKGPVAISQGTADNLVLKGFTDKLVDQYRAKGTKVEYFVHENATHSGVVEQNAGEALKFFKKVLR